MSRNKEKAQSGLNRYYEQKLQDAGAIDLSNRPRKVQSVRTLAECERWRKVVMGEFSAKLSDINNPSLSEAEVRELNDTLNRLFREKRAWEHHIYSLGGNNHMKYDKSLGVRVGNTSYYGRAKNLPEVTTKQASEPLREETAPSLDYFGFYEREWVPKIDASLEKVREEFQQALNGREGGVYDQKDVEMWMVEVKKKELMKQLLG